MCFERQAGGASDFQVVQDDQCTICGGLMASSDAVAKRAIREAKGYEFRTFGVGVSMPGAIQEREDEVRSVLKLKGRQTIKNQLSAIVGARMAKELRKRQDKESPDLTILADFADSQVKVQSRPLFFYGRYTKPVGVAQKRERCPACLGRKCEACGQTGSDPCPSVEEKVGRKLTSAAGATGARFTWIGSEDRESVVSDNGRPFVVELKNPKKRKVQKNFVAGGKGGRVHVSGGRILPSRPTKLPSFRFRTRITARTEARVSDDSLRELAKAFRGAAVVFDRPHEQPVTKNVYSVRARARGGDLLIEAELDGGLPVKRFVSGDLVSPSVSEILKTEARCRKFDICGVRETGKFEFGKVSRL